jgi:hypothetical protein
MWKSRQRGVILGKKDASAIWLSFFLDSAIRAVRLVGAGG